AHLVLGTWVVLAGFDGLGARLGAAVAIVYLVPPLAVRLSFAVFGRPGGELRQTDAAYRVWWLSQQWQMLFARLPALEEGLRLVPWLHAAWIALWGGRLSPRAFVAPGVRILDRPLVEVEAGAVLGFAATLAGHAGVRAADGGWAVIVAAPRVEAGALVGAGCGLGPGAVLRRGATLPIGRRLGPGAVWPREGVDGAVWPRERAAATEDGA
ncbi:MAG: hypothetical protein GX458_20850, partial [Phyllobacteriaceae bacterium]|nr:hypothetical protein [Phyllobacteriaceae bacterium]